jgi:predicted DNA repair protein MutK
VSIGLLALLDDVVGLTKIAAASLDDVTAQAARAGVKAAGVVIDDAAVTPRYVVGFSASRELPIVWKIAVGSVKNKLLYLLPAAMVLSYFAPWSITPLLMLGGAYLCYEGAEKIWHALRPPALHADEPPASSGAQDSRRLEDSRVRSAIQTDFILSAEIMALTLASLPPSSTLVQAIILAVVGVGITALVYGGVALIVKADDVGVSLAGNNRPLSTLLGLRFRPEAVRATLADRLLRVPARGIGRGLVAGMPHFLRVLGIVGTAAMLWVGGGILLHGIEGFGLTAPGHLIHEAAAWSAASLPPVAAAADWLVTAAFSGVTGFAVGTILIPLVSYVAAPVWRKLRPRRSGQRDQDEDDASRGNDKGNGSGDRDAGRI